MSFNFSEVVAEHDGLVRVMQCSFTRQRALAALRAFKARPRARIFVRPRVCVCVCVCERARGVPQVGDVVLDIGVGSAHETKNKYTVQLSETVHATLAPQHAEYVMSSCAPNVFFDLPAGELRAIAPIAVGDIIASFYPSHEWDMEEPFDCGCGAVCCVGRVSGAKHLSPELIRRYKFTEVMARLLMQAHPELDIAVAGAAEAVALGGSRRSAGSPC